MKVLFFIDNLQGGGKERRLSQLMIGLKSNPEIEFCLAIMNRNIQYKEVFDLNIDINYIIRKTKKDISVYFKLYRLCKSFRPDIVHCWDSMTAVYSVPVCKLLRIKVVNGMVIDSPQIQNFRNKDWLRAKLTFLFSTVIIGNSDAGLKAYGAPTYKSFVIRNGYDFNRNTNLIESSILRAKLGIETKYVVGMVATFNKYKDYATYFSAAQLLLRKRNDITFLALGYYTDSAQSKNLIKNEYMEHFRLLGKKSDIESFINMMDICVLSTFTEGISNAILEYMALAKPVVATLGGGTNEIVVDNKTGFLISPSNPVEFAAKLELLLNNPGLSSSMGLAGKDRVLNEFLLDKMVIQFINLYKLVLEAY
jgi:glycosyltransferase involved in cell wall biosynthesis